MKSTMKRILRAKSSLFFNKNIAKFTKCFNSNVSFPKSSNHHAFRFYYSGKINFFKRSAVQKRKSNFYGTHLTNSKKLWGYHNNQTKLK